MVGHAEIARDQPTVTPRRPLIDTHTVITNFNNFFETIWSNDKSQYMVLESTEAEK